MPTTVSGPTQFTIGTTEDTVTFSSDFPNGILIVADSANSGDVYFRTTTGVSTANGVIVPKAASKGSWSDRIAYPPPAPTERFTTVTLYFIASASAQTVYILPA
jgi:hypothetical protein